jgi:RNA polymerase sigma-B factor
MGASTHDSRSTTIEAHLPLVRSIAQRYVHHGEPLEDLVQAGTIGLIKAVDRFDPDRHPDVAALARPSIEGEIRHHLRDAGPGPRVSRPERELAARLAGLRRELTASRGRAPTVAELAVAAGVDEDRADRALGALDAARPLALDSDHGEQPSGAVRADDTEAAEARVLLEAGWSMLDERERRMLELRYREDRSQSEIARELGLSQAHVSRLLRATLERLRATVDPAAATEAPAAADGNGQGDQRSGRLLLRLPRSLHADLVATAEREGVSLNAYISGTLAAAVAGGKDPAPASLARRRLLVVNAIVIALAALAGAALLLQAWLG